MQGSNSVANARVRWLSQARSDLVASRLLHEKGQHGQALFHLQQASEKSSKGQLISLGLIRPSPQAGKPKGRLALAGLTKKDPKAYGHEVMPALVSSLKEALPRLKEMRLNLQTSQPTVIPRELSRAIERTEKEIQGLIETRARSPRAGEDLAVELAMINSALDRLGLADLVMKQSLDRKDERKMALKAQRELKRLGHDVKLKDIPPVRPYVESGMSRIRDSLMCTLSSELAWALFPLESQTRYPSSDGMVFDENNPYVRLFDETWNTLDRLMKSAGG